MFPPAGDESGPFSKANLSKSDQGCSLRTAFESRAGEKVEADEAVGFLLVGVTQQKAL